jgi:cytochrome c oxidase cbb3-type subunit III
MPARMLVLAVLVMLSACRRSDRSVTTDPHAEGNGGAILSAPQQAQYATSAFQIGEGQRLFQWMNCAGCHGPHGGGGMGPSLMDAQWRYGSGMADIVRTIDGGRPNGMPSFHNRLTGQQMWQLAAYVRALSGLAPSDAVPSRGDQMSSKAPITQRDPDKLAKPGEPY